MTTRAASNGRGTAIEPTTRRYDNWVPKLVTTDPAVAASVIDGGGLAAIPTETVYGLAADATRSEAVERIFEVKGRPRNHPLILHVASPDLDEWERRGWIRLEPSLRERAQRLADQFWPGPLTMVLPGGPAVLPIVTGGRATVALRVPSHPGSLELLTILDRPVAAPSANRFGRVSPTTADHVVADIGTILDPHRDIVLDGGASVVGLESTIVELSTDEVQLLRHGAHSDIELEAALGMPLSPTHGPARASGMLEAHYAPTCEVIVAENLQTATAVADQHRSAGRRVRVIDLSSDASAAARTLYTTMRTADDDAIDVLVAIPPPPFGIGRAVRDRLQRAATGSSVRASS